jgi:septal ring factor EnvC (AmiA/AmiB activator)
MELWQQAVLILIASLFSPLFLKMTEFVMNKSGQAEREQKARDEETAKRINALGLRVDELRDSNTRLMIQTETQQRTINEQAHQITELKAEISKRDARIQELETQVEILQHRRKQ